MRRRSSYCLLYCRWWLRCWRLSPASRNSILSHFCCTDIAVRCRIVRNALVAAPVGATINRVPTLNQFSLCCCAYSGLYLRVTSIRLHSTSGDATIRQVSAILTYHDRSCGLRGPRMSVSSCVTSFLWIHAKVDDISHNLRMTLHTCTGNTSDKIYTLDQRTSDK